MSKEWKINGVPMIAAQDINVSYESLATPKSGRTDDGVMHIDYIWRRIRKILIKLPPLTQDEISSILDKVQGREYKLTYRDPIKGLHETLVYTSNSSADYYKGYKYGHLWHNASFSAIEMAGER